MFLRLLKDIFEIGTGIVSRRKEAPPGGNGITYKILTLKSIDQRGYIDVRYLDEFKSNEEIDAKYLTKIGDILIRLSAPFTAATVLEDQQGIIVSSLFAILRPNRQDLLPEFVCVYLNSDIMKKKYLKDASGSALQSIKTSSLREYAIEVLDVPSQRIAIEINKLMIHESKLLEELLESKKQYNKMILTSILTGGLQNGN